MSATRKVIQSFCIGLAIGLLALGIWALGWLETWEARTWDWRVSLLAEPGEATKDIRLILLDQNSLDWALKENGLTWPWPREMYGAIAAFCRRSGARSLGFDVLFTEPSVYGVEDDARFASQLKAFGRSANSVFLGQDTGKGKTWPDHTPPNRFRMGGITAWKASKKAPKIEFPRATLPVPGIAKNSAVLCNVHAKPDADGIYRRVNLFNVFDGNILPSMGLGTYVAANPEITGHITPGQLVIDGRPVPIDDEGRAVLRYRGPSQTHKAYSAAAVIQSEINLRSGESPPVMDTDTFRDKYVLFGFTAPGLYDLRSSPVGGVYPGVEIQATMLDNFLSGDVIEDFPIGMTITLVLFLSLLCAFLASFYSSPVGNVAVSIVFLGLPVFIVLLSYIKGLWLPLVVMEVAMAGTLAVTLMVNYITEGRQKRFIKNAFRQYLSPAVIDQLIKHPERLKLGGERRTLSIFFSDLQGFTSISEGLSPEDLTSLLNDYLSAMTDIIHEEGGTVDKYEGDAIIAFWNAPLEVAGHADRAVRAALRCQFKLAEMRPAYRERMGKDMLMRIGINTGPAVVGNMGSHTRFDYTMMGDAVNLAARLEGINKAFGTFTLISQSTRDIIGNEFSVRETARVAVMGRKEPVTIYEPMYPGEYDDRRAVLEKFHFGLHQFYEGQFQQALDIFSSLADQDPPSAAYAEKCGEYMDSIPEDWKGVWVMTTK
ncbi:MAG: adenylate/guanylate cyclase domain-containing protein [Deltaproteobacteria bacterium]|nr:adenylate/guanylate cyclase domain-containing protein [Deltaproteobacteria bacterium]